MAHLTTLDPEQGSGQDEAMAGWDIFCKVVDNYGDAGVAWRLARQLAGEHAIAVRLWIDQPAALARLWPRVDASLEIQNVAGVEVRQWRADAAAAATPAAVVIEAFACDPPAAYVERMASQPRPPVWINLEYLSAETWVERHHGLPSPHPRLPLVKHFFFPGFGAGTGGLLRERGLLDARDAFQGDAGAQDAYWTSLGVAPRAGGELRISLFAYENPALAGLFDAWCDGPSPVLCLVPEGRILPGVAAFFGQHSLRVGDRLARGRLGVQVLPFTDQPGYDRLLWACDWNFVRGEDSFVRAQWAARPFVWQIYPQPDAAHHAKLQAFRWRHDAGLEPAAATALDALWQGWNGFGPTDWRAGWSAVLAQAPALRAHAAAWAKELATLPDLAGQLVEFAEKVAR
jgi:uncharacterized repeat protein (TIGR03837 family)